MYWKCPEWQNQSTRGKGEKKGSLHDIDMCRSEYLTRDDFASVTLETEILSIKFSPRSELDFESCVF
jgi:hypothetical protein